MIIIIDNYDSFTYNLVQYIGKYHGDIIVKRNDETNVQEIESLQPDLIVLSPGPCTPNEAGISVEVVHAFAGSIPILGVCLGHQTIVQAFGGVISRVDQVFHGKTSQIIHDGQTLFEQIVSPFTVGRYHSLIADAMDVPDELDITATTPEGAMMAVRHKQYAVEGVQFHPESILTNHGEQLIKNFLDYYQIKQPIS